MSKNVYFLNDFQKSMIENKFPTFNISFEDDEEMTGVILNHPRFPNGKYNICESAFWHSYDPKPSSINDYVFVKRTTEDIVKMIEGFIDNLEILE